MSTIIKLKRSSVPGHVPTTLSIELSELCINTYDGKIYFKKDNDDILKVLSTQDISTDETFTANSDDLVPSQKAVKTALDTKVDKVVGKELSSNDYTTVEKNQVELLNSFIQSSGMSVNVTGGDITLTGGINFSISGGTGFARNNLDALIETSWATITTAVPIAGDNFVYVNYLGDVVFRTDKNNYDDIFIGYIVTNDTNTGVLGFNNIKFPFKQHLSKVSRFFNENVGVIVESGLILSPQIAPDTLKVTIDSGVVWSEFNRFDFNSTTSFRKFFKDSNGSYIENTTYTTDIIDNTQWNDSSFSGSGALVPLTTGYYKKDSFFISTRGNLFYQYGTSQYSSMEHALSAAAPMVNPASTNVAVVCHIIIQEGNDTIRAIIDTRPIFSRLWGGDSFNDFIQTVAHHQFQGLDEDDHLQYHTDARGDARYFTQTQLSNGELDTRYFTETEVTNLLAGKANSNHIHPNASSTVDGFMTSGNFDKLAAIENNATANETDAFLVDRINHTGTQDVSTITGLVKGSVGLGSVDNTSDINKPISSSTQTALNGKVDTLSGKGLSTNDFTDYYKSESELATHYNDETGSSVSVSGGIVSLTGGINFSISPGVGYTRDNTGKMVRVTWTTTTGACTLDGDNFINIDYLQNVVISSSAAQGDVIALGYIRTALGNTTVVGFSNTRLKGYNHLFNLGELFRSSIGSLVQAGCNTAMQATPNDLKITVGSGYIWSLFNRFTIPDTSTFTKLFNTADYGFIVDSLTTANTVNTAYINTPTNNAATALVPMTTSYYKKDLIALTPEGTVFYVYATTEWATLDEAKLAPVPAVPENIKLSIVRSASIVTRQGATTIETLFDIRPMFSRLFDTGQAASNATVISHSNLTDLNADDHLQYHNDVRGDARYYRKSELDAGALNTLYFTESEITALLAGKANYSHTHLSSQITDLSPTTVGLGNVPNIDATDATNITSGTLANSRLTTNLTEIGNIVKVNGGIISVVGGVYSARTISQYKTDLALNNVLNFDTTNATNITSGTLANSRLTQNLLELGNLVFNNNDIMQYVGGVLTNVSPSQYKTSLSLVKGDVGLGNVPNTDATNASNISTGTLSNNRLTTNLTEIGNITFAVNDFIQHNGSGLVAISPSNVKTALNLTKSDVGLNNVPNTDATNATNISTGTLSNNRLTTNLTQLGNITFATNDFIQYNGTTLVKVTPSSVKTSLSLAKGDVGLGNVPNVDTTNASNITSGTIPISVLPAGALERLVVVANQTARFALTTATVQNGDTVKQNDTGIMYYVVDDTNLSNSAGYETYTAGAATSVPYSGVTSIPSNISQLGGITFTTNDIPYFNGTIVTNISPSSYKSLLSLSKTDVGLSNVVNSLQVINAGNGTSFASGTNASKPVAGINGRLFATTDSGIFLDNGTSWILQQAAITGDISISANSSTATLATVNSNIGTFNNVTVNGKGLVTAASNVSYLTANQTITVSGDLTGSGTTGLALTLATVNSNIGTFNNVTVNGKGLVTAASNVSYLTTNQSITLSGDFTGSGTTAITGTLATVNSNVGTFGSTTVVPVITVNAKGLTTSVTTATLTNASVGLGNVANSLQVINAGNGTSLASGTTAARPTAGTNGRFYGTTDGGLFLDNGTSWVLQDPAYTGDVTKAANATALTLATVNSNIGTFNNVTVNGKGLVTAASNVAYLTGNQSITLSGDFTGSGTTAITGTLATVNSNIGTFNNITINAKGLATAGSNANYLVDSAANGVLVRTALNTTIARTMTGTTNTITVTNGDGVSGNPTFTIANNPVIPGTASMTLPIGTTAQRDTPTNGQIRYNSDLTRAELSDTNVWRPLGKMAQFLTGDIVQTTGTTILPYDATLPVSTEGFQIWTQTITPTYTNSTIVVIFNVAAECSVAADAVTMALFNGTTAIATSTGMMVTTATSPFSLGITKTFSPGVVTPITLSARIGPNAAATVYVNRGNTETFAGTTNTSYIIMEIV